MVNRAVAHDDWLAAIGDEIPLPIPIEDVEAALGAAGEFADELAAETGLLRTKFSPTHTNDAFDRILRLIEEGLAAGPSN